MKSYIVVSAVGKDRPGFVNRVTHAIHEMGGNIEMQRSTRMADEFAVLILFSLAADAAQAGQAVEGLAGLRSADTFVTARMAVSEAAARTEGAHGAEITASGADQPGIIDAVTLVLFQHQVNIESMDYDVDSAPMTGEDLFRLKANVAVPPDTDTEALRTRLRAMEEEYNFDIIFRYPVD